MPVTCSCPSCGSALKLPSAAIGQRQICPACRYAFRAASSYYQCVSFVIYDLETTGLYPDSDEFIQIAAVRFQAGSLMPAEVFHSYARPRRPISRFIENYTGVTNADVADASRPEEVLRQFAGWADHASLIAHNGLRFDSKFLTATCRRHNLPCREVDSLDSIHLSKLAYGTARGTGHSMDRLITRLGLTNGNFRRHDARGDVELLGKAVAALHRMLDLDHSFNGLPRHTTLLPV